MKILIVNGSHRAGNTDLIVKSVQNCLKAKNIESRELRLRDIDIKLPDGCEHCAESEICPNIIDEFSQSIEPTIRDYDIYLIVTPVWSDFITPLTKIFIDRLVSWCHPDRMYLKDKKLAIISHGMADPKSWEIVRMWVNSICSWEKSVYSGNLTLQTSSKVGEIQVDETKIDEFILQLTQI